MWVAGFYQRWMRILEPHYRDGMQLAHFFGHMHTDEWMISRACAPNTTADWKETSGIKWCSGGKDYAPGDIFHAGLDGVCPVLPEAWDAVRRVEACEGVCAANEACLGFTYYQMPTKYYPAAENASACCFRTGSVAYKPLDPNSTARCYEKNRECEGKPLGVMVTSPSLSYAYPAANPAIRLLEFSDTDFALRDMHTYTTDLHVANKLAKTDWRLEYSFAKTFGCGEQGVSAAALAALVQRMARNESREWQTYRGAANGTLWCRGWQHDTGKADTHCAQGCQGGCKINWLQVLNGTSTSGKPL
jgi:hypothetical protein